MPIQLSIQAFAIFEGHPELIFQWKVDRSSTGRSGIAFFLENCNSSKLLHDKNLLFKFSQAEPFVR